MSDTLILIFSLVVLILLNFFFKKKNILLDSINEEKHKSYVTKIHTPLTGGIYFFLVTLLFLNQMTLELKLFLLAFFCIGLFSDLRYLKNALKKFFLQLIIILFFFIVSDIEIKSTTILWLDNLLLYKYFNILFCIFCLMILINGFNFIDGLNGLSLGYFLIIFCNLFYIQNIYFLNLDISFHIFLTSIFCLFIFIILGKNFLGDSGSYLIGSFAGFYLIFLNYQHPEISPWYIILLLWYPCFEILFSIFRKLYKNNSPFDPDNSHLHQLLFKKLKNKFSNPNPLGALIILAYNFPVLFIGSLNVYDSKIIISLIILNLLIYVITFLKLKNNE
jgi:UDP-N-acetylmuramyl pentapeptide phosphotransferase/UDP-N-acetylglucosamine-1-phosphate transferase